MKKVKVTSVSLPRALAALLKQAAAAERRSASEIVRMALSVYFEQATPDMPPAKKTKRKADRK